MDYRQQDNSGDRQSPYGGQPGYSGGQQDPYGGQPGYSGGQQGPYGQGPDGRRRTYGTQLGTAQPVPETASATVSPDNANSGGVAYAIAAAVVVALMLLVIATSFGFSRVIQEVLDSGDPALEQPFSQILEEYSDAGMGDASLDTGTIEG